MLAFGRLGDPSEEDFHKYELCIKEFLWNDKKAKIPLDTLYAAKEEGGLKLPNLKVRNVALKIQWIFAEDQFFVNLLNEIIPEELGITYWWCHMVDKDVDMTLAPETPVFWRQVCKHWFHWSYYYHEDLNTGYVRDYLIWYKCAK